MVHPVFDAISMRVARSRLDKSVLHNYSVFGTAAISSALAGYMRRADGPCRAGKMTRSGKRRRDPAIPREMTSSSFVFSEELLANQS